MEDLMGVHAYFLKIKLILKDPAQADIDYTKIENNN
jgi:hypothetical protein